jgi:hypothetical protein
LRRSYAQDQGPHLSRARAILAKQETEEPHQDSYVERANGGKKPKRSWACSFAVFALLKQLRITDSPMNHPEIFLQRINRQTGTYAVHVAFCIGQIRWSRPDADFQARMLESEPPIRVLLSRHSMIRVIEVHRMAFRNKSITANTLCIHSQTKFQALTRTHKFKSSVCLPQPESFPLTCGSPFSRRPA